MTSRDTPSARSRLDSFLNILKLEESKGFQNTAVMGGLDRFLERNASAIADISGDGAGIPSVPYRDMTPPQRREWAGRWLARLGGEGEAGPRSIEEEAAAKGDGSLESVPAPAEATLQGDESSGGEVPSETVAETEAAPPPPTNPTPRKRARTLPGLTLESPVDRLRGVDAKLSAKLLRLRVHTIRDLIYLSPGGTTISPRSPQLRTWSPAKSKL